MNKYLLSTVLAIYSSLLPVVLSDNTTMTKHLKVLVSSNDLPASGLKLLQEHFTVVQNRFSYYGDDEKAESEEECLKLVPGCSAIVWASGHPITDELLDKAGPNLKIVATTSAGYNHCNVEGLKARGIKLTNTPGVLSAAVAEIAVTLMLVTARRFPEWLQQVDSGKWVNGLDKFLGKDIRGSTVGIVGFGGIGQATAKRLAGFEVARIIYSGHREKPEGKVLGAEFVSQDDLLKNSDFVVLAAPLTDQTRHMINQTTLAKMKKNAIIINVGRGDLIDQEALYEALKNKDIYAAGLDVTTPEPLPPDHKLLKLSNVFVTPHIGSGTERTRNEMSILAATNVINALTGKPLVTPVLP
ncbi:glyoxylate reductase/hydroxypyruvate reductase-like [Achroia grisella]|uniref:glyoxylate reductase/hydroxypyruvate reductase-like n=1 Tax=Achroia grisella TaxID=688607 RepID=UPI0027D2AF68|nr:glyoxylate reductase/hydroxypyruvate reductase-like [Achroia grisella]